MNGENICDASTFFFFLLTTVYFKLIKSINRRDICWCAKLHAATMFWNLATYQRLGYIGGVVVCTAYFLSCWSAGVLFVFFLLKSEGDSYRQNMDTLLGTLCSYCLSSSWHNFRNGLETFWSVWTHHHAVAFVDCKLYQGGTNLAWDLVDAEAIWVQCIHCHVQESS